MELSGDPEVQVQEGGMSSFRLELSNQIPGGTDRKIIARWKISHTETMLCIEAIVKIDKEIKVLKEAKAIAPQLQKKVDEEIKRKVASREDWTLSFLRCIAGVAQSERELLAEIGILQRKAKELEVTIHGVEETQRKLKIENDVLQRKAKGCEVTIRSLQKCLQEKSKSNRLLEESVRMLESKLGEKDLLAEAARNKDEENKSQMEEAHRLECAELRLEAQRAEAHSQSLSKELLLLLTAVEDKVPKSSKLEKDHSGTRLRSAEITSLAAGGQNDERNWPVKSENIESATEQIRADCTQLEMIMEKIQANNMSLAALENGQNEDRNASPNLENNMEPETESQERGDLIQSETILQTSQSAASKRRRGSGRTVRLNVSLEPQGNKELTTGQKERKKTRVLQ